MENSAKSRTNEEQMLDVLSMSLYGRAMHNRCSIVNRGQRQVMENTLREMASTQTCGQEKTDEEKV